MEKTGKEKRRVPFYLLINKDFQLKFTVLFSSVVAASIFVMWITFYSIFRIDFLKVHYQANNPGTFHSMVIEDILNAINYFFFWEGLTIVLLSIVFALLMSRLIIGPLYRIEKELHAIDQNPDGPKKITIRKGDYCQSMVDILNSVLNKVSK